MTSYARRQKEGNEQAGFTLLELTVVVVVISILFLFAYQRYLDLLVDVEKASMEQTVGILRSAVGMKVAKLILDGKVSSLKDFEGTNPVELLAEVPKNYAGESGDSQNVKKGAGFWSFDKTSGLLIYRVKNKAAFHSEIEGFDQARFRLRLVYEDNNKNGRYEEKIDDPAGLSLKPIDRYSWFKRIY